MAKRSDTMGHTRSSCRSGSDTRSLEAPTAMNWIEEAPRPPKTKRKPSDHRVRKLVAHATKGGKGVVGRLRHGRRSLSN